MRFIKDKLYTKMEMGNIYIIHIFFYTISSHTKISNNISCFNNVTFLQIFYIRMVFS